MDWGLSRCRDRFPRCVTAEAVRHYEARARQQLSALGYGEVDVGGRCGARRKVLRESPAVRGRRVRGRGGGGGGGRGRSRRPLPPPRDGVVRIGDGYRGGGAWRTTTPRPNWGMYGTGRRGGYYGGGGGGGWRTSSWTTPAPSIGTVIGEWLLGGGSNRRRRPPYNSGREMVTGGKLHDDDDGGGGGWWWWWKPKGKGTFS